MRVEQDAALPFDLLLPFTDEDPMERDEIAIHLYAHFLRAPESRRLMKRPRALDAAHRFCCEIAAYQNPFCATPYDLRAITRSWVLGGAFSEAELEAGRRELHALWRFFDRCGAPYAEECLQWLEEPWIWPRELRKKRLEMRRWRERELEILQNAA